MFRWLDELTKWLNAPLGPKSPQPKFPVWPVAALLAFLFGAGVLWTRDVLASSIPAFAAFIMVCLAHIISGYFLVQASDTRRKAVKSLLDLSWNIWTAVGLAFTFSAAAGQHKELSKTLENIDPTALTILFVWASFTAVGRVIMSILEVWTTWRAKAKAVQGEIVPDGSAELGTSRL